MGSVLPSFTDPPVVEVVMGVQFEPLDKLFTPHAGLFWETVRSQYPVFKENPPIVPQMEEFKEPGALKNVDLELTSVPPFPRIFFEHDSGEWLIQLQKDRFLHNWRSASSATKYPRYDAVRKKFLSQWSNFRKFIGDNELGDLKITQLEITYLNHIAPWTDTSDIGEVFPDFQWRTCDRVLSKPEACNISCAFMLTDETSRLRVNIKPGIHKDKGRILLFNLTARGAPHEQDVEAWFDDGRGWIVRAFKDLTSQEWHKKWGLIE